MALVALDRQLLLDLPGHVAAEAHVAEVGGAAGGEVEDDGRGELVLRGAAALDGLEDVDRVPDALGSAAGGGGCEKRVTESARLLAPCIAVLRSQRKVQPPFILSLSSLTTRLKATSMSGIVRAMMPR